MDLKQANIDYTKVQAKNSVQDNLKQLMVALDKTEQEWTKLSLEAGKEQQPLPSKTSIDSLYAKARALVTDVMLDPAAAPDANAQPMDPMGPQM